MADPGEGPGGPGLPPLLLGQTEALKEKKFFWIPGPPLSQGLDPALTSLSPKYVSVAFFTFSLIGCCCYNAIMNVCIWKKCCCHCFLYCFFICFPYTCKLRKTNPGKFAKMFVVEINALISGIIDSSQHLQLQYDHYRKYHNIS